MGNIEYSLKYLCKIRKFIKKIMIEMYFNYIKQYVHMITDEYNKECTVYVIFAWCSHHIEV